MSIFLANLNGSIIGNEDVLLSLFWGWWVGGRVCTGWVGLQVNAEKMKIYSYIHVGKSHIHQMFPKGRTNSKCLYSRIYLIWHPQDWRGAGLLNIPCVKQYLFLCFFIP